MELHFLTFTRTLISSAITMKKETNTAEILYKENDSDAHNIHCYTVHTTAQSSPFSKEVAVTYKSPLQNYRGFLNLAMLFLFVFLVRMMLDNYLLNGFVVQAPNIRLDSEDLQWVFLSLSLQIVSKPSNIQAYLHLLTSDSISNVFWNRKGIIYKVPEFKEYWKETSKLVAQLKHHIYTLGVKLHFILYDLAAGSFICTIADINYSNIEIRIIRVCKC